MKNEMLSKIYLDYVNSDAYSKNTDTVAMDKIRYENGNKIEEIVGTEMYLAIEDFIAISECKSEFYGFVMGFKYAMQLMIERTPRAVKS